MSKSTVRLNAPEKRPSHHGSSSATLPASELSPKPLQNRLFERVTLPSYLTWIPTYWKWSKIKPAIRCAVAAWISLILIIIPKVVVFMGQASFLILISSVLSPPAEPLLAVLEREVLIIGMVSLGWAWGCLGMKLADLAREVHNPNVTLTDVITGEYLETAPTIIMLVFMLFGTAFFLFIRARRGPGPYLFACIFGCVALDITVTTAVLYPYPLYTIGKSVIIPLGFHSAIALSCSVLIFPSTISAEFTTRLADVLAPLSQSLELHIKVLKTPVDSDEFSKVTASIVTAVKKSESALVPLAASGRLLESDLIYGRFAPSDFRPLQKLARRMSVRANGMSVYFGLIDPTRERFPNTPAPSHPNTPGTMTPVRSRAPSVERDDDSDRYEDGHESNGQSTPVSSSPSHHHHHRKGRSSHPHSSHFSHSLHRSLMHLSMPKMHRHEHTVGVFESQRYQDLEHTVFNEPESQMYTQRTIDLLASCCGELLEDCQDAVSYIQTTWLSNVRRGRWKFWISGQTRKKTWEDSYDALLQRRNKLSDALLAFKTKYRHNVVEPYRAVFGHRSDSDHDAAHVPSHRYLFHCYVYQYHLQRFVTQTVEMLDEILQLEKERRTNRLWTPVERLFLHRKVQFSDTHDEDEDPDTVQGLDPAMVGELGLPRIRDPDALPPRNRVEWVMGHVYRFVMSFGGGNVLYAFKAGLLTVIMCIPSCVKSSAMFAYNNKFFWAIFMGQLTIARFRGDTTFGLVARIMSTFFGSILGMLMWYMSCGTGNGNPYGLAAVAAVFFFPIFFSRLYWPVPPMTKIIFFVTTMVVIGYSYADLYVILPSNPGIGWQVAWRRIILVTAGVTAAFLFSFLPPSTTLRRYQRATLATTCTELGTIYCEILSYASTHEERESTSIVTSLIAIRSKLDRAAALKANVIYEFSLRGRWPAKRYHTILDLQMQLAYSLSHLLSIVEHLEPAWTRAFLRRTRFSDPEFQGDLLAVISLMATALRTGGALPQITPCPLIDRYLLKYHGLNVIHSDAEDDYGLPRMLTMETLQDEQYMMFCVGVSSAFSFISRLDRLMLAVKEVVGEQYGIRGMGMSTFTRGVEMGSRTNTITIRLPGSS